MKQCYCVSMILVLLCSGLTAFGQQRTVSGTIKDTDGTAMPGVNVIVKGTSVGATSDSDGRYTIAVPEGSNTLVYSFIGFTTQEVELGNRTVVDVALVADVTELSEVVVTALGVERSTKALQYSATAVDGDNLTQARVNNLGNALSGRVAGVNVSNIATGPAGSSRVIIRGNKTLAGNNQPLYVVDGIPMDNSVGGQAGQWSGQDQGDQLLSINPDDIESMNVLKGASATALYGSRGGNGVINIVTKKGRKGKGLGIEFNSNLVAETVINQSDLQKKYGTGGYVNGVPTAPTAIGDLRTGRLENGWGPALGSGTFMDADGVVKPYVDAGDNWKRFYETGKAMTNSLSISGGGENQTFRFSAADLRSDGIIPNTGFDRQNVTLSTTGKFAEKVSFDAKVMYSFEHAKNRPTVSDSPGNAVQAVWRRPANINIDDLIGDPEKPGAIPEGTDPALLAQYQRTPGQEFLPSPQNNWGPNPWWVVNHHVYSDKKDRVIASGQLRYDITDFLYASTRIGIDWYAKRNTRLYPQGSGDVLPGSMQEGADRVKEVNMEWMLGFNKTFNKVGVNAFVGGNRMRRSSENMNINGSGFNVPYFAFINNVSNRNFGYSFNSSGINSLFGSLELSYNNYLFLTATAREDWFSVLNPETKNEILYPSVGASFVFSDAFETMPSWMSFGKVRASWAQTGLVTIGAYDTNLTYSLFGNTHLGRTMASFSSAQGRSGNIPNPNIVPALSTEIEFGVDTRLFNNAIGLDVTYYSQATTDDIIRATIPLTTGFGTTDFNLGKITNKGIEILLTGTPVKGALTWDVSFNFAKNKNTIVQLLPTQPDVTRIVAENSRTQTSNIAHIVGESYGMIIGTQQRRDDNGNLVYRANGQPLGANVTTPIGNGIADWTGGLNNSFTWKGINLSFLIDIKVGGDIHSGTNQRLTEWGLSKQSLTGRDGETPLHITGVTQQLDGGGNPVFQDAPTNQVPVYIPIDRDLTPDEARNYWGALGGSAADNFIYDASFGKLRQLTLGYSLPATVLTKTPFQRVTLSLVGRNLAILWKNVPNIDPESSYSFNGGAQGLDYFGMPTSRSYGFNLNLAF